MVMVNCSDIESVPSEASTIISYWLSVFASLGDSKSGFELNEIAPDVEIDNLSSSAPDKEKPIVSFSWSRTDTDKTFNVFSSIDIDEIKSSKVGASLTLATSTNTLASAVVPSTLTW